MPWMGHDPSDCGCTIPRKSLKLNAAEPPIAIARQPWRNNPAPLNPTELRHQCAPLHWALPSSLHLRYGTRATGATPLFPAARTSRPAYHYGSISSDRMGLVLRRLPRCLPEMRKASLTILHLSATSAAGGTAGTHLPQTVAIRLLLTDAFSCRCVSGGQQLTQMFHRVSEGARGGSVRLLPARLPKFTAMAATC
jgi:hypothetical protein